MPKAVATKKSKALQEKRPVGRPPIFETPENLQIKFDEYFTMIENERKENPKRIPEITEMALFCGFASRQSLHDQRKRSPEFSYIVNKARSTCVQYVIRNLTEETSNPTKWIYIANAMGYHKDNLDSRSTRIGGNVIIIKTNEKPDLSIDNQEVNYDET